MSLTDGNAYLPGDLLVYDLLTIGQAYFVYLGNDLWLASDPFAGPELRHKAERWTPRLQGSCYAGKVCVHLGYDGENIR